MPTTLNISESFYSIQAEGVSTGVPSYFIRLANCNLNCGIQHDTLQKIRKLVKEGKDSYSQEIIDIMNPENDATWVCDSIPVWTKTNRQPFEYIFNDWKNLGIEKDIQNGTVHIIFTGGEPLMPANQYDIISFLSSYRFHLQNLLFSLPYIELETNGTQHIGNELFGYTSQINCSVKLSNSGHSKEQRIIPDALTRIMQHDNYWFKFVVSSEEDIYEITNDFIIPFNVPKERVLLMPALSKQEDFHEKTKLVYELAKKYKFRATQRMHISAWDCVTGV